MQQCNQCLMGGCWGVGGIGIGLAAQKTSSSGIVSCCVSLICPVTIAHKSKLYITNNTMNYLFVALSLLTVKPQACFGFTTSNSKPSIYFRTSHDDLVDSSIAATPIIPTDDTHRDTSFMNGPHAVLDAAIVKGLCEEDLAGEGRDDLSDDELVDECFI
eukprot:scaffold6105_cov88-Skeletonema_dohrnii-CCMP3373.AAC.3